MTTGRLIRQEQAQACVDATTDRKAKSLFNALLTTIWRESQAGLEPVSDFDLEFLAKVMLKLGSNHELLRSIVSGDNQGTWPE